MAELPTGTVTLVFTDIEGSTRLLETLGECYGEVLAEHRSLLRQAFSTHGGIEVDTQGDAFFYAFPRASDAVVATSEGQRALADHTWPEDTEIGVRMGIHTGEPALSGEGYVGADVHRAARICSAAHGGQVLVSEATARLLGPEMQDLTLPRPREPRPQGPERAPASLPARDRRTKRRLPCDPEPRVPRH